MRAVSLQDLRHLARGVDIQLALEDIVNDRLAEVIHDMSIPMLQGQSGGMGREKGVRAHLCGSGAPANGEAGWGHPAPCSVVGVALLHPPAFSGADNRHGVV